jgi:hypothetical protein
VKPPAAYPTEPKKPGTVPPHAMRCGWTWAVPVTVDGRLPTGFGAQYSHVLEPVMPIARLGQIGWAGAIEAERRTQLKTAAQRILEQLQLASTTIDPTSIASVRWLVESAGAELTAADQVHAKWLTRAGGPFPLSLEDRPSAFHKSCAGQPGAAVPGTLVCPSAAELAQRMPDRRRIRDRFEDAAAHLRCAEYWLWRVMLYREALAAWAAVRPPTGAGGLKAAMPAKPPPAPLDLTREPPPAPPPMGELRIPPGPPETTPGQLAPPGWEPGTPPPEGEGEPIPPPRPRRRKTSIVVPGVLGMIGLAVLYDVVRGKAW